MKRRSFFGALAGLCAAPLAAKLPVVAPPVDLMVCGAIDVQLVRYEFAEFQAAMMASVATGLAIPYEQLTRDFSDAKYVRARQ